MKYEIKLIRPEQTRALRHKVLWPHIQEERDCVIDIDAREDAFHLGCFDQEKLVSIGSFFQINTTKIEAAFPYRLRAMATDPEWRGKHAGSELILFALDYLKKRGVDVLWCDARKNAVGFYNSLGFEKLPQEYDVPKIGPHYFMWKRLSSLG